MLLGITILDLCIPIVHYKGNSLSLVMVLRYLWMARWQKGNDGYHHHHLGVFLRLGHCQLTSPVVVVYSSTAAVCILYYTVQPARG